MKLSFTEIFLSQTLGSTPSMPRYLSEAACVERKLELAQEQDNSTGFLLNTSVTSSDCLQTAA